MKYNAKARMGARRNSLLGPRIEYVYWAVENERGESYANITDEIVEGEEYSAQEFAEVLAYALSEGLPVSESGGLTPAQFHYARDHMNA